MDSDPCGTITYQMCPLSWFIAKVREIARKKGQHNPFEVIQQLATGEITAEVWGQRCTAVGIPVGPLSKSIAAKVEQRKVVVGWKG